MGKTLRASALSNHVCVNFAEEPFVDLRNHTINIVYYKLQVCCQCVSLLFSIFPTPPSPFPLPLPLPRLSHAVANTDVAGGPAHGGPTLPALLL